MTLRQTENISSPCKLICDLDLKKGQCVGCGRTREEIARWLSYTELQRRAIMAELPGRLAKSER
jgi:predicted Fe-S protein YdhL (DUF1289 family)